MSRRPVSRRRNFTTSDVWTDSFAAFFENTQSFNGSDIVIDEGIVTILKNSSRGDLKRDIPQIDRHLTELLFASLVDNFQSYLTDLLLELFQFRPEILSGGSVKNAVIFDQPDLDSLKRYIIERQILDLGYKRVEEVDEYFKERFKFSITESWLTRLRLNRLIQVRNVITHNRGFVNRQLIFKAGLKLDTLGEKVGLPNLYATDIYLIRLAEQIDCKAIQIFGLPHNKHSSREGTHG